MGYIATLPPLSVEKHKVCVTISGQPASNAFIERLASTGLAFVPCTGNGTGEITKIPIGELKETPNGGYVLYYGYLMDSEPPQGQMMFAYMHNDPSGWHVLRVQGSIFF